jgi:hypothetical protein
VIGVTFLAVSRSERMGTENRYVWRRSLRPRSFLPAIPLAPRVGLIKDQPGAHRTRPWAMEDIQRGLFSQSHFAMWLKIAPTLFASHAYASRSGSRQGVEQRTGRDEIRRR